LRMDGARLALPLRFKIRHRLLAWSRSIVKFGGRPNYLKSRRPSNSKMSL
jgi:hypothetical protein